MLFFGKMGFSTQRIYETSIRKYEDVVNVISEHPEQVKCTQDLTPENGLKLLTFRLKKYEDVAIQISLRKCRLMLQGVKWWNHLLDLRIIREITSLLSDEYPNGISFKFLKQNYGYKDKDEIINHVEQQNSFLEQSAILMFDGNRGKFEGWIDQQWNEIQEDSYLQKAFTERLCSIYAKFIAKNGFHCKPDGSLKIRLDYREWRRKEPQLYHNYMNHLQRNIARISRWLNSKSSLSNTS